jgi:hypothetical protein
MNVLCAVMRHKWEMHNSKMRGDRKSCSRCGKERDFHPDDDRKYKPVDHLDSHVMKGDDPRRP